MVFTDPEIAWVGLTETQAADKGIAVKVSKFPWAASGRALTLDRADGVTKILADPGTGKLLGVAIAGPGAGDLISEAALALEMDATAADLARHHPSAPHAFGNPRRGRRTPRRPLRLPLSPRQAPTGVAPISSD